MKTVLLTGATGYLGGNLAKKLLDNGFMIIALALNKTEKFKWKTDKNVQIYYLNEISLDEIFCMNKIDYVIHTATLYGRNNELLADMIKANVEFPLSVLNLAIQYNVEAFINTDTILVKSISPYALTKSQFAEWLEFFNNDIKCINMRLDHFYGPNDKPVKFIAWLVQQLKNNVEKIDLTEGSQTRDFIYVDDVVEAYLCVLNNIEKVQLGQLNKFEVGTNIKTSIKTMVKTLKSLMNNTSTVLKFGAIPYRKNEVLDYDVDTTALRLLGWSPKINNIETGLKVMLKKEGYIK